MPGKKDMKVLGSISPIVGMATGQGLFGKTPIGHAMSAIRGKRKKGGPEPVVGKNSIMGYGPKGRVAGTPGMKHGGKVGRGDGCVSKGKTKGTMR